MPPSSPGLCVEVIRSSQLKLAVLLVVPPLFAALAIWLMSEEARLVIQTFLGCCIVACVLGELALLLLVVRPYRLCLYHEGFALDGGDVLAPRLIGWSEVKEFIVHWVPGAGEMVAFNYWEGRAPQKRLMNFNRLGVVDDGLPIGWPMSAAALADKLNACRAGAVKA